MYLVLVVTPGRGVASTFHQSRYPTGLTCRTVPLSLPVISVLPGRACVCVWGGGMNGVKINVI
jgi:hypothetical protein